MFTKFKQLIGWFGTSLVVGGYVMLSLGIIGNDWRYHVCMLIGSSCLAWVSYRAKLWEIVALNICFAVFGALALVRLFLL